ncbi:hypothetical protein M3Y99_00936300 [Aphelenchoides fujianensis]|nr:hypothetical protein M3Y99_00936300 [Aphelenchoides fujianensis]
MLAILLESTWSRDTFLFFYGETRNFQENVSKQIEACFEERMKVPWSPPGGRYSYHVYGECFMKAPKDYALHLNAHAVGKVEGKRVKSRECVEAIVELDLSSDPRMNLSDPLTTADRSSLCSLLGDFKDHYCKVRAFCPESQGLLEFAYTAWYLKLHIAATGGKNTDEDCPAASIPFAQIINPNAYQLCFDVLNEPLLNSTMCD